jgi:hypothetical protein
MNSIVVLDYDRLDTFLENEETGATVFTNEDNLSAFEINKIIEVWRSSPSSPLGSRYLAIIVEKPARVKAESNVFKIKVCKIGNLN